MNKKSEVLDKASVVRWVGNTVHCINHSPLISATKTYRLDSDVFNEVCYPPFGQRGPGLHLTQKQSGLQGDYQNTTLPLQ